MEIVSEALHKRHDRSRFRCGVASLDDWLARHALDAERRRTARTFVWHPGDRAVVAYYSLAAHLIVRDELPPAIGRGDPGRIPALLLARLALDSSLRGLGYGGLLLAEAMSRAVRAAESAGARYLVVDAVDERAAGFYIHHGFHLIPGSLRLVRRVTDVAAAVGLVGIVN